MTTIVYKFGLLPPISGIDAIRAEILGGHHYSNALVAVERARREALREYESAAGDLPALSETARVADEQYEMALRAVRVHRARSRKNDEPQELKDAVKIAREERKLKKASLREARHRLRTLDTPPASYLAQKAAEEKFGKRSQEKYYMERKLMADPKGGRHGIEARVNYVLRGLRAERECAWGTGGLIEGSRDAKRKMPLWANTTEPNDPRFRAAIDAWRVTEEGIFTRQGLNAEGRLGVQIQINNQSEMKVIFAGEHKQVKIARQANDPKTGRRMGQRFTLHIHLGDHTWGEWPMIMHRPIPPAGIITGVEVTVKKEATRERWSVQFTVKLPEEQPSCGRGAVAIDLGWRLLPSGDLRVACWQGDDERGELTLPAKLIGKFTHAEELRSLRDELFNHAKASLVERLKLLELPQWFVTATEQLTKWKSPAKLDALAVRWRTGRFTADEDAYVELEGWRQKNRHLWQWETGDRQGALGRRKDLFRVFGAMLSKRYGTCVWEKMDLSTMARIAAVDTNRTAARHRFLAATGELRLHVKQAFGRRGGEIAEVSAVDSTHICPTCGSVEEFDAAEHLRHTCSVCNAEWDQDEAAAIVLLARYKRERSSGNVKEVTQDLISCEKESKWSRAHRMANEKRAHLLGAREEAGNDAE